MGKRCPKHGLAVSLDGRCVRCRREDQRKAEAVRSRFPGWTVIIAVLVTVGALGYLFFGPRLKKEKKAKPAPVQTAVVIKPDSRLLWEQLGDEQPDEPVQQRATAPQPRAPAAPTSPAKPASTTPTTTTAPSKYSSSYLDLVRGAASRVRVEVYYTTWCPACTRARKWLVDNQIPHHLYDVERTEGAKREIKKLNPRGSIPTIKVGRRVLVGFSSSSLCRTILAEANR